MKRKAEGEAPYSDGDETTKSDSALLSSLDPSGDICEALMRRYGKSAAPQHRHLCASAAAMRSILLEEGLPLSPPAYLAAAVHTVRSTGSDPSAASAIASFLSILLPLIQNGELSTTKAGDAISILAVFLKENKELPTGTVRSVVRVLGMLVLHADKEDWKALELPLDTLLAFSVDKRPKVRKSAQEFVDKIFTFLKGSGTIKNAEKTILAIFDKYIQLVKDLSLTKYVDSSRKTENTEESGLVHFLNLLKFFSPHLSKKSLRKCFSEALKLLTPNFNVLTRHLLKLFEALLEHLDIQYLSGESETFISSLIVYISKEKNPTDTVVIALELLKDCLNKLKDIQPSMWSKSLPPIFEVASGYISSDVESSKEIGSTLKELIVYHIDGRPFLKRENKVVEHEMESSSEATAIISICSSLCRTLSNAEKPAESLLGVISVLLLKLDESSCFFTKEIILRLSQQAADLHKEMPIYKNIQECIGCAVIAMGPEKIISLIPINLDEEKSTCSNTWLIPILNKYTLGASLQFFMDHIVPLADSVKNICRKGKKGSKQRVVQSWINGLWGLLPAFCRYPSDIKSSFGSLVDLLIKRLKEESSLHEIISKALQELINRNKTLCSGNQENVLVELMTSLSLKPCHFDFTKKVHSEKSARKNLKVLASHSMELISTLSDIFFDSSAEKRAYLKDTVKCLASVAGSTNICTFYLSLVKRLDFSDVDMEDKKVKDQDTGTTENMEVDKDNSKEKQDVKRHMMLELTSTFVAVANEDLLNILFDFIRTSLLRDAECCHGEAFFALSCILKEKSDFCLSRVDEIMLLLHNVKSSTDNTAIMNRLSCYHHLLVHMLKVNEDTMNNKAFLILNEIILALKSKKESRSLAYDVLLAISSSLKSNTQSDLQRLFTMVMGYLSSPSSHITSGAISALSLLIYNDAEFCLGVPNLIPSVLVLLQNKSNEVIKAALGFVKVLVSTLQTEKLIKLQGEILKGILPWSVVSKFHFRSKVGIIIEILIRKCGFGSVDMAVPQKYKGFVKTIAEARRNKKNPKEGDDDSENAPETEISSPNKRAKKSDADNVSATERRRPFSAKGSAGKSKKIKKPNLNNTSEKSGKSGKGNLKFQPQAESKGDNHKRKKSVSEQQNKNKRQKVFGKARLGNNSDKKPRSFGKTKKNAPRKSKKDQDNKAN
ncbi:ARM repeat superfamily protein [Rhynchospora pubera]|uniref:ARM repeat superfamily protein n=1 Tax=Rhynchospora pubera TaxID=906938 RepID=A0AAV8GLQ6_9POAL|nr:ARM repeat superfamily protein [Rhynchospora pubera]